MTDYAETLKNQDKKKLTELVENFEEVSKKD
jgi:hypothetical protein